MAIDWDKGDKLIRAGVLTNREIAKQLSCSEGAVRKRVKSGNVDRDLTAEVRKAAKAKLVRTKVRTGTQTSDNEIIEEAAELQAGVVRSHRKDISKLRDLEQEMIKELGDKEKPPTKLYTAQYQGKVIMEEVGIAVTERSSALNALAAVQQKRIQLERQAFNIEDGEGGEDGEPKSGKWVLECK